jgi:beta-1,4-mannosyl-glycoprotein beta-1,4-N-acetylglucosaminyltransferase
VDLFVIVESAHTLAGTPKPFFFEENIKRFEKYLSRIKHIKLDGLPPIIEDTEAARFWLEAYQRDSITRGIFGLNLRPDDIIMISDVDEIPRSESVRQMSCDIKSGEVWVFEQVLFYYYFDYVLSLELSASPWLGTAAVCFDAFGRMSPEQIRRQWAKAAGFKSDDHLTDNTRHIISNGGWHLSYFGGDAAHKYKMINFAHGAGSIYGDARTSRPVTIEKRTSTDLKDLDPRLSDRINEIISNKLLSNIPSPVINDLLSYYHHFGEAHL